MKGEGIGDAGIVGTDAGSFAAIPKSLSFQDFDFAEYRTGISENSITGCYCLLASDHGGYS